MANHSVKIDSNGKEIIDTDQFYRTLFEYNPDMVYFSDPEGIIAKANEVFFEILGYKNEDIVLSSLERILPPSEIPLYSETLHQALSGKAQIVDTVFLHKNGKSLQIHLKLIPARNNGEVIGVFGMAKDITASKKVDEVIRYYAYHDALTDLPNRIFFQEKVEQQLIISKTLKQKSAIMYLDIDRFKNINHSLGTLTGDKVLEQIAKRLKIFIQGENILARVSGDQFGVLIPNIKDTDDEIITLSKEIIEVIEQPFFIEVYKIYVTLSIGISIYPNDGEDAHTLMNNAQSALYKAKDNGKNTFQIYSSSMDVQSFKTYILEVDLRNAMELNQLELYYQPKVNAVTHQIVGAEALIRWNHPEWGLLSPGEFLPLAEESGLMVKIEKWTARTACFQNKAWQQAGLPAIPISINFSANRFLHTDLIQSIADTLIEFNLDPQYMEIEILETSLLENAKVVFSILDEIRKLGIKISLDDFGTGYSSLSYLKRFKGRIDTLKIDRSFISDLSITNQDDANFIVESIVELAHHLKMKVVTEGVETKEQLDLLTEFKCDSIQGYYFSKPIPADAFAPLLRKGKINVPASIKRDEYMIVERRKYARIQLDFPLLASMTLIQIQGRKIELGKTDVLIENIGAGGLCLLSWINLPIRRKIILEFETEILGRTINMQGVIVWVREVQHEIYQYGFEFLIDECERTVLTALLNQFSLQLRENPLLPDCCFVKMDRYHYFAENSVRHQKKTY